MVKKIFAQTYLWVLLLLLYSPIVIIVIYSFTEAKVLGNWTGFSTKLYSSLFNTGAHHSLMNALVNTITIALLAATASTLLGSIAAIGIFNLKARSRKAIGFVNSIPILNGDIITGISLFLLFVSLGITQGYTTVVLAHITFCTPYVVLSVLPRLKQMNPNIYEAALDLGATPMQALRKVIIPEIRPGMISGFMLALTLSIDDFAVTVFTIGNQGLETLSTYIYADARKGGLTPELRPLSTIIFVVVLALLIALCVLAEFFRLSIIAYGVRNALQESVISVATTNYNEVYDGLREGYSGGYFMTGDCWEETLDYGDVYTRLDRLLGTNPDGAYHVKWQGNGYEYRVTDLNVSISNAPFAPGNASQNFEADVSVQLEIPLSFGWEALPPVGMTIRAKAAYMPKF